MGDFKRGHEEKKPKDRFILEKTRHIHKFHLADGK